MTPDEAQYEEYMDQLYEEHKEQAIQEFIDERLQSYYGKHRLLAAPAFGALKEAKNLIYGYDTAAFLFSAIAIEVGLRETLVADKLRFLNLYPRWPLIWNVVLKTIVFGIFVFLFLFIEELLRQAHKLGSLTAAYKRLGTDVVWPVFWTGDIWLNILLLFYCAAAELTRAVGAGKVKKVFFSRTRNGG